MASGPLARRIFWRFRFGHLSDATSQLIPRPGSAHGEARRGWTVAIQVALPAQLDLALQIRLRTDGAGLVLVTRGHDNP